MNKQPEFILEALVDFPDDALSAPEPITETHIDAMVRRLVECGVRRVRELCSSGHFIAGSTRMTDYAELGHIDFLPELAALDLEGKAQAIQSFLEENFFHSSGLFYSILLIDGSHHVRPMARADLVGASVHAENQFNDGGATRQAAQDEGMTFENSIYSAGLYLQAQAERFTVTGDPNAYAEGRRALNALRLIYDYAKERGRAGWLGKPYGRIPKDHSTPDQYHAAILGLYRFRDIAAAAERDMITAMLRDIADFLTRRNYQSGWVACCRARRRFTT